MFLIYVVRHKFNRLMKNILSLFICLALCSTGYGQSTISLDEFLKNSITPYLSTTPSSSIRFKPSWLDQIDFRTQTDEFEPDRQQYTFRFTPSSAGVRKAQKRLFQLSEEQALDEQNNLQWNYIEETYEAILDLYELSRKIAIKEELLSVLSDKEQVYTKLIQAGQSLPKEWISTQQAIAQLQVEIFQHKEWLQTLSTPEQTIDWSSLVAADSIARLVERLNKADNFVFDKKTRSLDIQIIDSEIQLKKAEGRKIFDFFQVEYRGPTDKTLEEKVSLTAAFQFPFSNKRKLQVATLAIEKEIAQEKAMARQEWNEHRVQKLIQRLQLHTKELAFRQEVEDQQNQQASALIQDAVTTPLLALGQQEKALERQLDLLKVELQIYHTYLDYLELTERLYQLPLQNYLSL